MRFRKAPPTHTKSCTEIEQDTRLAEAEKRAGALYDKTEWLHTVVMQRDRENHWQASVNQLFVRRGTP